MEWGADGFRFIGFNDTRDTSEQPTVPLAFADDHIGASVVLGRFNRSIDLSAGHST